MTSMAGYLLTETLFCFTLAMSLLLFILALKKQNNLLHCLSGFFFGLSYLVNPVIFFFPFIATLVVYYFFNENKLKKQNILLFLGCFLLIFALWSVRGMVSVKGESDSSLDRAETNFIIGSHSDFYDIWRKNPRDESLPKAWEMAREEPLGKILGDVMRRVAADPVHYSYWYFIEKPYLLWSWNILTGQGDIYIYPVVTSLYKRSRLAILSYSLSKTLHYWALFFALFGLLYLFASKDNKPPIEVLLVYSCLLYVSAVYVVLQAEPRYSIPLRPELYLAAAFDLGSVLNILKRYKRN